MIRFHEVLDAAVGAVRDAAAGALEHYSVTLVRDLAGRIQLFIDKPALAEVVDRLHAIVSERLGPYTEGTIWAPKSKRDPCHAALAKLVRADRRAYEPTGGRVSGDPDWFLIERHISKSSWTLETGQPPWPLQAKTPAIVSFYSFKGGVGRSTALAVVAALLARQGYRVTVVDLDLEAPGVETILLPGSEPFDGVLDYLLEKPVHGSGFRVGPLVRPCGDAAVIGAGPAISVLGAGAVDQSYIEKLARLDVERMVREHGAALSTHELFEELRSATSPDVILVDCRAGFHDLGGLALSHMSHLVLVFATYSPQTRRGLQEVVRILGAASHRAGLDVRVVQTMLPDGLPATRTQVEERFRGECYEVFAAHFYDAAQIPDVTDTQAQHCPMTVPELPFLRLGPPWDQWDRVEPVYAAIAADVILRTGRHPTPVGKT